MNVGDSCVKSYIILLACLQNDDHQKLYGTAPSTYFTHEIAKETNIEELVGTPS